MWHPDRDAKGTLFLFLLFSCIICTILWSFCLLAWSPLHAEHLPHDSHIHVCHTVHICGLVTLDCVEQDGSFCSRGCLFVCLFVTSFIFVFFKILLIHWTPVLLAEILPIFMLHFHSSDSDIHLVFPCRVHRNEGWINPSHCPWMQF